MLPSVAKGTLCMRLRILRWGDYPSLCEWTQCNHNIFYKKNVRGVRVRGKDSGMMEAETGVMLFEEGQRGQKPRARNQLPQPPEAKKKAREWILLSELPGGTSPSATTLTLAQGN